jgi:hypothetical protein
MTAEVPARYEPPAPFRQALSLDGSTCPMWASSRRKRARPCAGCFALLSPSTDRIRRSASGGIDLDDNPDDRRWLLETFKEAKALVPNALVVDNSPCFPRNYHLQTDVEDFHWYNGFPHQNEAFAATTRAFAARASFAWSPHEDARKRGDKPLICSEFGVWGMPNPR